MTTGDVEPNPGPTSSLLWSFQELLQTDNISKAEAPVDPEKASVLATSAHLGLANYGNLVKSLGGGLSVPSLPLQRVREPDDELVPGDINANYQKPLSARKYKMYAALTSSSRSTDRYMFQGFPSESQRALRRLDHPPPSPTTTESRTGVVGGEAA